MPSVLAVVVPNRVKLLNPVSVELEDTPFTVLVRVLVVVAKEEVLEDMTLVVAITPLTVEVKILPVTD